MNNMISIWICIKWKLCRILVAGVTFPFWVNKVTTSRTMHCGTIQVSQLKIAHTFIGKPSPSPQKKSFSQYWFWFHFSLFVFLFLQVKQPVRYWTRRNHCSSPDRKRSNLPSVTPSRYPVRCPPQVSFPASSVVSFENPKQKKTVSNKWHFTNVALFQIFWC